MRGLVGIISLIVWLFATPTAVTAEMKSLSVTVTFRERIALPPGARLSVQIFEAADASKPEGPIAFQSFAISAVPMTVSLTYDPKIVDDQSRYGVLASISRPGGRQMFRATETLNDPDWSEHAPLDIVLKMRTEANMNAVAPRSISGVPWTVTEILGEAWQKAAPPTFVIDDEMNFAIFGGCNRLSGRAIASGRGLSFPENMAATMMVCPDSVEKEERRFLAALLQVSDYVRYSTGLVMTDAHGRALLHFTETPE